MDIANVFFYVVQNSNGEFFRRKGYGGSGSSWVKSIDTARVWIKISGARSVVTYFANNYPGYPVPKIVKLTITATEVIDETERVEKARLKKKQALEQRELLEAKRRLKAAEEAVEKAQQRLEQEQRRSKR